MDTALFRKARPKKVPAQMLGGYGLACGATVLAAVLTLALVRHAEQGVFALFFAAVFVSARYGGLGPGLLATALTSGIATLVVLPKLPSFSSYSREILPVALYAGVSLLTTSILTKLRRTTQTLLEKEQHLSDFIEEATVGMNWVGEDGQIFWANKAELALLGYAAGDYVGRNLREFCVDAGEAQDLLGRLGRHETFQNLEIRLRARDGGVRVVLFHSNIFSRDGHYVRARCFTQDVSGRKAAEQALAENEVKFRALFEHSLDAIGVSRNGVYSMVNSAYLKLFGYERPQDLLGTSVYAVIAPAHRPAVEERARRRQKGEAVPPRYETRGLRRDGSEFDLEVDVSVFELKGERYTQAILRDISFRKQAELEMRHWARQQEEVAALGQQALAGEDPMALLRAAAERVCASLNTDYCEVLEFVPLEKAFVPRASCAKGGDENLGEGRTRGPQSETGYAFTQKAPVIIEDAEVETRFEISPELRQRALRSGICVQVVSRERTYGVLGIYQKSPRTFSNSEIHFVQAIANVLAAAWQRQAADEMLREREFLLRRVLDTNPNFILVKDREGRILLANEALAASYRMELDHLVGRRQAELHKEFAMSAEEVRQWLADDLEVIETGRPKVLTEFFTHRDGSEHWYSTRKLPFILADQDPCVLIISEDITERKAARDELNKLNGELERRVIQRTAQLEMANKELEAFSYSISHDLRAPLRAIFGFSQIIREDYSHQLDTECLRLLDVISQNTRRMGQLIEDLLAFSRVTRVEIAKVSVDVDALVRNVVHELTVLEPERSGQVEVLELPGVQGDQALLQQVFTNLVTNALKFTRQVAQPRIEIGCRTSETELVYYVRDNGVGFDMKYVNKLFKVFQRLHKIEQFEGTGVGLAIIHRIISRHGGRVWAEGSVDAGATFFLAFPIEDLVPERAQLYENNSTQG